jgi:thiol-disulfide isomerase/thioredoxin
MSTRTLISVLLAGTAGMIFFLYVHLSSGPAKIHLGSAHAQACDQAAGDCLPDVKYIDTKGTTYSPQSLAGKVVVVNFWATWCGPCQQEIPSLSRIYAQYKDKGVVFLGIMADQNPPSDAQLASFESQHDLTYPVVRVNSDILVSYNYPEALPTTFVFNKKGKQVYKHLGPISEGQFSAMLDAYVAEK